MILTFRRWICKAFHRKISVPLPGGYYICFECSLKHLVPWASGDDVIQFEKALTNRRFSQRSMVKANLPPCAQMRHLP